MQSVSARMAGNNGHRCLVVKRRGTPAFLISVNGLCAQLTRICTQLLHIHGWVLVMHSGEEFIRVNMTLLCPIVGCSLEQQSCWT